MAKRESTFGNMVLVLLVVTLVSATILGFVYDLTKDAIDLAKMKAQSEAIEKVLPAFDDLGDALKIAIANPGDSLEVFPALQNGALVGVAVKSFTNKGFSGFISVMVGIDKAGSIYGYEVLEHAETPGLGSKMDVWFRDEQKPGQNVIGKSPATCRFEVKKDGGDVDAITASTITSRAFMDAIVRAFEAFDSYNQQPRN